MTCNNSNCKFPATQGRQERGRRNPTKNDAADHGKAASMEPTPLLFTIQSKLRAESHRKQLAGSCEPLSRK